MASTLKFCREELIHDFLCHVIVDETAWHDKNICIVVLADQVSHFWNPTKSSANALMLVERHGNALAGATDADARIDLARLYALCKRMAKVGVVATLLGEGTIVFIRYVVLIKIFLDVLLQGKAGMITCQSYCFNFHLACFYVFRINEYITSDEQWYCLPLLIFYLYTAVHYLSKKAFTCL